ncbi:unnamed protein product, partial [Effrenium voratum]
APSIPSMAPLHDIDDECFDTTKPYVAQKTTKPSLWSRFCQGSTKATTKPTTKAAQSLSAKQPPPEAASDAPPMSAEEAVEGAARPESEASDAHEETEVVESADEACEHGHEAKLAGDQLGPALQDLHGLKEAISGLQRELYSLKRDNGALRSALCAKAGGILPVESANSPSLTFASQVSTTDSVKGKAEDELASATLAQPQAQQPEGRQKASKGGCWEPLLDWCDPADESEEVFVGKEGAPRLLSPLATTAASAGTFSAAPSTAASPQMKTRPVREPPMDSSRDLPWLASASVLWPQLVNIASTVS